MSNKQLAIIIGGFIPAVLFGVSAIFLKVISKAGAGLGPFFMGIGLSIFVMGALFALWDRDLTLNARSLFFMISFGVMWTLAMACVTIAIKRYDGQIGQLVSIYNMNTLVTVVLSLAVLSEWRNVQPVKLFLAAILIVVGGILATQA